MSYEQWVECVKWFQTVQATGTQEEVKLAMSAVKEAWQANA